MSWTTGTQRLPAQNTLSMESGWTLSGQTLSGKLIISACIVVWPRNEPGSHFTSTLLVPSTFSSLSAVFHTNMFHLVVLVASHLMASHLMAGHLVASHLPLKVSLVCGQPKAHLNQQQSSGYDQSVERERVRYSREPLRPGSTRKRRDPGRKFSERR